jgi:hypothetical protein
MRLALLTLVSVLFASCTTVVSLDYRARPGQQPVGPPAVIVGKFIDQRGMEPRMLGTVGVPGVSRLANVPMENVVLSLPVEQAVENAFGHALQSRAILAPRGANRYTLSGDIIDLHCETFSNPYATGRLRINLISKATGRVVYTQEAGAERQSVFFVHGTGDPVPVMREIASRVLQDCVDQVLDSPAFRAALK